MASEKNNIEKAIARQAEHVRLLGIVIPIVEEARTQTVSKRLATKIEKAISDPAIRVSWNPDKYGSKEITIAGGILDYDNALSIRFSLNWGDGWKLKSEQEATDDTISLLKAWQVNGERHKVQLERELERLDEMVKAYAKIARDYKQACEEFNNEYGTQGDYSRTVSYTTRGELERITGVKIEL